MFCYTFLSNLECGLREVAMWSHISSEHPIFLTNVAQCLNITLDPNVVAGLQRMNQCFTNVYQEACRLLNIATYNRHNIMYNQPLANATAALMQQFLQYDQEFLGILQRLQNCGQDQPVWQTLVHHIEREQTYMYRLISTLCQQIFSQQPNIMPPLD